MSFNIPSFARPATNPLEALSPDIQIFVLAHWRKQAVTIETLGELAIPFTVYENKDWEWPADHPELATDRSRRPRVRGFALRQYRAFRGHQEIARRGMSPISLVFEDDMTLAPTVSRRELLQHINAMAAYLRTAPYEAVSLYGRNMSPMQNIREVAGRQYGELVATPQDGTGHLFFLEPVQAAGKYTDTYKWQEGCLAYMLNERGREKWANAGHADGLPCDLFLANELHTLSARDSLFQHDCRNGSLIDNYGNAAAELTDDGTPVKG